MVLGVFQVAVAYILLTNGLRTTPAVTASLVSGIEPVLNPILVAVFYKETMGFFALVGAAIVIVGVVGYNVLQASGPFLPRPILSHLVKKKSSQQMLKK